MEAKLYGMAVSHPANAGRLMLERKGVPAKIVKLDLLAGVHDLRLRAAGFEGGTVPALKIDGRRVQGTREIARALEELVPDPPLFGTDPQQRAAIEEAEAWGEQTLQPVPRVIARAALAANADARRWFVGYMGLPKAIAPATVPVIKRMVKASEATPENARGKIAALPALLDRADALIAEGTIGGGDVNAADCQIAPTVRFLLAMEDLRPRVEGRPAADLARRLLPDYAGPIPAGTIPAAWLS